MFVAGEHCDKETMEWTKKVFDCPVLDNWWQTGTTTICSDMMSMIVHVMFKPLACLAALYLFAYTLSTLFAFDSAHLFGTCSQRIMARSVDEQQ